MTPEQRLEIQRLAGIAHDKRAMHQGLGMLNVNAEPEQARQNSMAYAVALAELNEAQSELDAAIRALTAADAREPRNALQGHGFAAESVKRQDR